MRTSTVALALLLSLTGGSAGPEPPDCVTDALTGESDTTPAAAAPRIEPAIGTVDTVVRIEGEGFPVGESVMLIAIYAENGCVIQGLGDQLLGATRVDPDGVYRMERPWPERFTPLLGRGSFPPTSLPDGSYYIAALPCARPDECSLTEASAPGGPFVQSRSAGTVGDEEPLDGRDRSEGVPVGGVAGAGAGAFVILAGVMLLRRLTR